MNVNHFSQDIESLSLVDRDITIVILLVFIYIASGHRVEGLNGSLTVDG